MCSCARLPYYPPFKPIPTTNLKPKPASPRGPLPRPGPVPARHALAPRAAAGDDAPPSSLEFLALKRELEEEEDEAAVAAEGGGDGATSESDGEEETERRRRRRRRRQLVRRSGLLAKQVISVRSARSLGFVSQLWVDASSWVVALVEVRPNLLSGEIEKFLFEDIYQVGDVVLVEDETVIENELKLVGLHSLVGYDVVTSRRRNVGKVRGFQCDINSGAMESLELDSFGLSIIPTSLVSTYCLFVEDVLDIDSDTVVVHEDAISRVQRLTKGIWGTQNIHEPGDHMDEYIKFRRRRASSVQTRHSQGKTSGQKFRRKPRDIEDDWELPMDY